MLHDDQEVLVNRKGSTPNLNNITHEVFVGGNPFTISLHDSSGLSITAGFKVQFNNSNLLDTNKRHHSVNPINMGLESSNQVLRNANVVVGGKLTETSASSDVFNNYWVDIPDAVVDVAGGVSAYVGSASVRYIRIKYEPASGLTAMPESFEAKIYHDGLHSRF